LQRAAQRDNLCCRQFFLVSFPASFLPPFLASAQAAAHSPMPMPAAVQPHNARSASWLDSLPCAIRVRFEVAPTSRDVLLDTPEPRNTGGKGIITAASEALALERGTIRTNLEESAA
jgi:hypothetical protein